MKNMTRIFFICLAVITFITGCNRSENVIANVSDAENKRIGVMTGSIGETLAATRFPKADVKSFDDIMDAVTAVKSGQLDAIITMYPTALQVSKKNPELQILPENLENEDTAIAVRKDNDALLAEVNRILSELKEDGTLESMKKRWFKADLSPYEEINIPLPTEGNVLRIGVSATREPLSFVDQNGRVTGYDGELSRIIGAKLKRPVEFSNMKFMSLIPALQSGKVDLIISGINVTPERKKSVAFSQTYFANAQVMLVKKAGAEPSQPASTAPWDPSASDAIAKLQQISGKKIGVMTGTTGEATAVAQFPKAEIKHFGDQMDAITATKSGQVDAAIVSFSSAVLVTRTQTDLQALPTPLYREDIAMAIRKGNDALLNDVNRVISELKTDGTLESMKKRWFGENSTAYEELNIPLPKNGKTLRIGVTATLEPFVFVDGNGKIIGHDSELARLIGAKLKRPVEFSNMTFMALIPALQSGKIDLIISSMTATDERRKSVDFSQTYFSDAQVLLLKKPAGSQAEPRTANTVVTGGDITKLAPLNGKRIGVLSGSAGDLAARQAFPGSSFQVMNSAADAALALKANKIDAFIYDKSVLLNLAEKSSELIILDEPVGKLGVAAAIGKENASLLSAMNGALAQLKRDGALLRLTQKWVHAKTETRSMPPVSGKLAKGVLRMGTASTHEPYSFQVNGTITGLDIELAQLIGEHIGKKIEIIDMNFESLIPALQAGKIDFALSNFTVTEERKKLINFTTPYIENDISVLVRRSHAADSPNAQKQSGGESGVVKNDSKKLASPADLKNQRIGVLLGSVHDTYAMKQYPDATILQYKSPSDMLLAVKSGKVDAAMYTRETLLDILRSDKELGLVGDSLYSVPIGMGFNKGNQALREKFNDFLRQTKESGVYSDMVNRWITQGNTTMPTIAKTKANGTLVVGMVSDKGLPYASIKNNQLIGFDIELAERFAAYLGQEIKFADMEFGSLIAAVSTNKIDMVASTLMLTEERQKQIDFSDIYYEMGTNIFALKKNIAVSDVVAGAKVAPPSFLTDIANSFHSNIILENRYLLILDGLKITVIIAVLASVFGTLLGALVCFMRMSKRAVLNIPAKMYISVLRGTPVLVLLMLIFYVAFASVDINPVLVAVIAFGMNFAAYAAEIFRTGIEGVDKGQTEAGIAMGFTKVNTFLFIVLPQAVRQILPVYKGEFISLVKMTSIVGYIAVQDLTKASDIIRSRTFDAFFPLVMVAILYFLISWVLMQALDYLERITDPKRKRIKGGRA